MATVIPFKGILYNPQKVDISISMAPPYDIVTPELKEHLYKKSPYNIIRVDFGKDRDEDNEDENRHTRASQFLINWLKEGILIKDPEPSFYCYEISYEVNGVMKKTKGFFGAVKIEEPGSGRIHPHEMTYSKPKSDRLNILRYCRANTSPIFSLYSSKEKLASSIIDKVIQKEPLIEASNGDGFKHRLWRISEDTSIRAIMREMTNNDIFIADGHHRYETALEYKKEMEKEGQLITGDEPFNFVLMFLANIEDEGLTLLPTHRIVEMDSDINAKMVLAKYFEIEKMSMESMSERQARQRMLKAIQDRPHSFGLFLTNTNTYYTLSFNGSRLKLDLPECLKNLDVTVLHKFIFDKLLRISHFEYEMNPDIAVDRARKGSFEAVFFLNSTKIQNVKEVAFAGHRMPPKSTYFYPKLLTGMIMYKFQ